MSHYTPVPPHIYPNRSRYGTPKSRRSRTADYSGEQGGFLAKSSSLSINPTTNKTPITTWAYIILPLFLHFILTLGIALLVLSYVNRNYFSLAHRTPEAVLLDGSIQLLDAARFQPLQSDVTTILSLSLAISRVFATVWCGSLCWRCAIVLMEKSGLTLGELGRMVSYGLPPFRFQPRLNHRHRGSAYTAATIATLLLVLPVQFASPVITGSITWTPFFQQYNAPNLSVIVRHLRDDGPAPTLDPPVMLRSTVTSASASGFRVWGGVDQETGAMQRVLSADSAELLFTLPANSTLNNITMPYFKITSFEWLADPERMLTPDQLGVIDVNNSARWTNVSVEFNPLQMLFSVAIAATPQELIASPLATQTYPVAFVTNTAMNQCSWDGWGFAKTAPTNAGLVYRKMSSGLTACYAFANVTYNVGAMTCTNCSISSFGSTVQTEPDPNPSSFRDDIARPKATAMMAEIAYEMTTLVNYAGVPQSDWPTAEAYVESMLRRSYMAGWNQVQSGFNGVPELRTGVSLPVEFSQGRVDVRRVWAWFALQMLVSASGILFVVIQTCVDRAPVKDTALVGLFLDTRDLADYDESLATTMAHIHKGTVVSLRRAEGRLLSRVEVE
ncbi:hypothetical protein FRC10_000860 [Ceratobasidium sp. 414]|nr:hypothetical protein FRC10_000860 [Ceratobasidium sp. 414]